MQYLMPQYHGSQLAVPKKACGFPLSPNEHWDLHKTERMHGMAQYSHVALWQDLVLLAATAST
jgi:hypothetical protein